MRRSAGILGLACALAVTSAAGVATAGAQTGPGRPSDTGAEHRRVVEFWTPERQAAAIPRDVTLPAPNSKPGAAGMAKPGGGGGGAGDPSATLVRGATWTGGGQVVKTTGKVFFRLGRSLYECSASAVASAHGNLVVTAGHCVYDRSLGWARDWIFYPAWNGRASSLGAWTATALFTTSTWRTAANFADDAGFAVVTNGTSSTLQSVVGAVPPISFNSPNTNTHYAFGYPAGRKYKGNTLTYCAGPVQIGAYDGAATVSMVCDMTGGASGGPWFEPFTTSDGTGTIRSLTSYRYLTLKDVLFGPILGDAERSAYNAAVGDATCSAPATNNCTRITTT